MNTDSNIVDGLKDMFLKWAITKGYTDRICWSGSALTDKYKIEPWFKASVLPMEPENLFRATRYSGIFSIDVIVKAATGLSTVKLVVNELLNLFLKETYAFKNQQFTLYKVYRDAEQTEGSYLIQPIRIFYEGVVKDT